MNNYWENRLAECQNGIAYAKGQIARIALISMDQLRIPTEQYGTEPCRLLGTLGVAIEAGLDDEGVPSD